MRILITGASGFTGQHLAHQLKEDSGDVEIFGLSRRSGENRFVDKWLPSDLSNQSSIEACLSNTQFDRVYHLAGAIPPASDSELWHVNVGGTFNLIKSIAITQRNPPRVLIAGSAAEYAKNDSGCFHETSSVGGETTYGHSKWAQANIAAELCRQFEMPIVFARVFNLVGPGLPARNVATAICTQFLDESKTGLEIGNIRSERDFVDVRDVVRAFILIQEYAPDGEAYNISTGTSTPISKLIEIVESITGKKLPLNVDTSKLRNVDLDRAFGSPAKIESQLGWKARITLKQALTDMLAELSHR